MSQDHYLAYVATVIVVLAAPGPSQLLMLSNSLENGFGRALSTAAGDLTANLLQMGLAASGLAFLVRAFPAHVSVLKWAGAAYLIHTGVRRIRDGRGLSSPGAGPLRSRSSLWTQGFVTSSANPKAIVFFAALFPQFLSPARPGTDLLILGSTYLVLDGCLLAIYAGFARWIATKLRGHGDKVAVVSGVTLIATAVLLCMKSVRRG